MRQHERLDAEPGDLARLSRADPHGRPGGIFPQPESGQGVFRRQGARTVVYAFDYDDVAEGRHLETNIELQRGDVVIVP